MIVDLLGKAVTEIRDFAAVAAITPRVRGGEFAPGDKPPAVVVVDLGIDYSPGNATRLGLQRPLYGANCYGTDRRQAAQLANAVVEAVNVRGPRVDATGRLVFLSLVESGGGIALDPITNWPFTTVTFTFLGSQQAVAVA